MSASTLLPTTAFAALSALTVLVVTQVGMSPLGALVGPAAPSARDGGLAVTSPRMSISIPPPLVGARPPADDRAPTSVRRPPTTIPVALAVRPRANPVAPVVIAVRPEANPAASVVVAVLTSSSKEPVAQPVPHSPPGQFAPAATFATTTAKPRSAVNVTAVEPPKLPVSDQGPLAAEADKADKADKRIVDTKPANDAKDGKTDKASDSGTESRAI